MLCKITPASGGLRTVDIYCCSCIPLFQAASDCTALPAPTHTGHTQRSPGIHMPVPLQACRWQRWWPGICRCCIGIEMAGDLALGCHGGEHWSERAVGCTYGQRGWKAQPLGISSPCGPRRQWGESRVACAPGRGRGDQGGGIWVPGLPADGFSTANLDEFAQVHDANPITHMLDSGQIVADQEIGDPNSACRSFRRLRICERMETSREDTGSSRTTRGGCSTRARAIPIR